jgi:hypothetical protein
LAVPPNTSDAFQREVDEELRREELAKAWKRYGILLVSVVVIGLAAYGGWLFWQHHQRQLAGQEGEQFDQAYVDLEANRSKAAEQPLAKLATSQNGGYRTLARFTQADLLLQKKDLKGAAAKFAGIAADASIGQPFRDLALIRQTSAEFDTLKPDVVINRLRPLATKGNPWFGSAGELVAVAYLRNNRRDLAGTLFGQMARDENVPDTIRQRAVQMAGVLGVDAVDQSEEKKAK